MKLNTGIQLSIMMFLQFIIWGAWYGQLSKYLIAIKFDGEQIGWIYSTFSLAMIVSPFIVGMIADRFFSAQKVLGGTQPGWCGHPFCYYENHRLPFILHPVIYCIV